MNSVALKGIVNSKACEAYESYGELFYKFELAVMRNSGQYDHIPVICSEWLFPEHNTDIEGNLMEIKGDIRTYNVKAANKRGYKLALFVFARETNIIREESYNNSIELEGYICKPPVYRVTPRSREIADVMLAVNRGHKTAYIPVIFWGRTARHAGQLPVGQKLYLKGRLQSREYVKKIDDQEIVHETYEISANEMKEMSD